MDKKERIRAAIAGECVDRVPTSWYTHFPDLMDNTVADQVAWAKASDMDMLCVETDGFMEYDCARIDMSDPKVLGNLKPHNIDDYYIQGQIDRAKRIAAGLKDDAAVTYMIFTPFSTIKHSIHSETKVMDLLRDYPDEVYHAMRVIEQDNRMVMELLAKESGIDGIFLSLQNNEIDRNFAGGYRNVIEPWDKRLIAAARELFDFTVLHLCAWRGVPNRIGNWRQHDCEVINWACHIELDMGLAAGRKFFSPNSTLMGGFDNRPCGILHSGNKEQITEYTHCLIENAGAQRLILSADCSVQKDTPAEHLRWVSEACASYASR